MKITLQLPNGTVIEGDEVDVLPMDRQATEDALSKQFARPSPFAMRTPAGIVFIPSEIMNTTVVVMRW